MSFRTDPSLEKDLFDSVNDLTVYHPRLEQAKRYAEQFVRLGPYKNEAPCSEISGPPGVGKTTLWDWLRQEESRETGTVLVKVARQPPIEADRKPYITVKLEQQPTLEKLCNAFLRSLGDPRALQGSVVEKTERVDRFLHYCQVRCVFIDEAQYVVDRSGIVIAESIIDWLRDRHMRASREHLGYDDAHSVALCLMGLGRLGAVFSNDGQRLRRFDSGWRIEPYRAEGDDLLDFQGIVGCFADACLLPTDDDLDFDDLNLIRRFHHASCGLPSGIKKVFGAAMRLVGLFPGSYPVLSLDLLEQAYAWQVREAQQIGDDAFNSSVDSLNPFARDFNINTAMRTIPDDRLPISPPSVRRRRAQERRIQARARYQFSAR